MIKAVAKCKSAIEDKERANRERKQTIKNEKYVIGKRRK